MKRAHGRPEGLHYFLAFALAIALVIAAGSAAPEGMQKKMGGPQATTEFARLFMVPGMGHCSGGTSPNRFDALAALEPWVEKGAAPEKMIASQVAQGATVRTRPLCVYPQVARWSGTGSPDEAANFTCTQP